MPETLEYIKSIPEFISAFKIALQTPWGWLFLIIIVIWVLINKDFSNLIFLLNHREKKKLEMIEKYFGAITTHPTISDTADSNEMSNVMKDIWDAIHFKNATGIYAERKLRDELIRLYNSTSSKIKWNTIRRALIYIEACECGDVYIRKMDFSELLIYLYNGFVGFGSLICSILMFIYALFFHTSNSDVLQLTILALLGVFISMFSFAQNWPNLAANRIKKELCNSTLPLEG